MKYILLEGNEVVTVFHEPTVGTLPIPDSFRVHTRMVDGTGTSPGTILTQDQIDYFVALEAELNARRQRIIDELSAIVGRGILSLTDGERWKLVAAVFYKLGVIGSDGVVRSYSEWIEETQ